MSYSIRSRISRLAAGAAILLGTASALPALATESGPAAARRQHPGPEATPLPTAPAQSGVSKDSAAVVSVVDQYHRALAAGDTAAVLRLLAPDAIILESGGVETRSEYLSHHLPGDIAFAQAVPRERGPIEVRVSGNTAWATSTSTTVGEYRERSINSQGRS